MPGISWRSLIQQREILLAFKADGKWKTSSRDRKAADASARCGISLTETVNRSPERYIGQFLLALAVYVLGSPPIIGFKLLKDRYGIAVATEMACRQLSPPVFPPDGSKPELVSKEVKLEMGIFSPPESPVRIAICVPFPLRGGPTK